MLSAGPESLYTRLFIEVTTAAEQVLVKEKNKGKKNKT